ncbi:FAD:protein FMN transferase [Nibrella saemangeumensis]|uniref:FAD:protein FMN transferase n=1 Tax=Nibrella saemangeumensis TaxID=1084526 RepID=A0ABP8NK09_9BACT
MKRLLVFFMVCLCSFGVLAQSQRYTFERGLMGTQFRLIFYAPDSVTAKQAVRAVYAHMDTLNQIMSDYLDGSEINRLSETAGSGRWVRVSPELFDVLSKALWVANKSDGRFDPTIGPLSQLWRRAVRRQQFPSKTELKHARQAVGYRLVRLDSTTCSVQLVRNGMKLDLGGIGQGFAVDEALKVLHSNSLRSVLIDLGGDILVGDAPPDQSGWRIDVGSGKAADADTLTLVLENAAITTSGDTYRYLEYKGRRYSHIMDPRSGLGLRHFVRATVLAPDGWRADALTKVFSVAGWRKSRQLLKHFSHVELYLLENKSGRLRRWKSAAFK